jgi:hypothetical protein
MLAEWEDGSHLLLGAPGCWHSTMTSVVSESTFCRLRGLLDVGRHHHSPCGRYLVIRVASLSRWSRTCIYSHSHHLKLPAASPSFASQSSLGGSCEELDLEALAKALPTLVGVDNNGCNPFRNSPR